MMILRLFHVSALTSIFAVSSLILGELMYLALVKLKSVYISHDVRGA